MVGLGVDFGDVPRLRRRQRPRHRRRCSRRCTNAGFDGRIVLASSMVVYGEGRYRCAEHGLVAPAAARGRAPRRRALRAALPGVRRPLEPEAVAEDAPLDPRNVYAATKLHQEHLCAAFAREPGAGVDRAALPQRLRAADAPRHARTPASRASSAARSRPGGRRGLRGRRPAARLRPRRRRRPSEPARARRAGDA